MGVYQHADFDTLRRLNPAGYYPAEAGQPDIAIAGLRITDTPDDFIVLDNVVLTPRAGLVWRDFWLADAIHYMPEEWRAAPWLPGRFDPASNTIDIPDMPCRAEIDQPVVYIDCLNGARNYGHFISDTLPYGRIFRKISRHIPGVRPLLAQFSSSNQRILFHVVFGADAWLLQPDSLPVRVRQLVLPRRQTNFSPTSNWSTTFAGVRYVRDALRGHFAPAGAALATGSRIKIYLHRTQDIEAQRRRGTLQGRDYANVGEILGFAADQGFVCLEPSRVPLNFLMPCLLDAAVVMGVHGAGMADATFCPPAATVIEIRSAEGNWRSLEALCAVLGQRFRAAQQHLAAPGERARIDPRTLAQALSELGSE